MSEWKCGAKRGLSVDEDSAWDGAEAKAAIFEWAGWPDDPDPGKARQGFLAYDATDPKLKGSYALPFATVKDGKLVAVRAGLNAAASRLPQTDDLPESIRNEAGDVLESYKPDDSADKGRERGITYSKAMRIDTRAGNSQDLVALARSRALDPDVFDQFEIFTFSGQMSNNNWDAYNTRMGTSSLKNYADEAAAGVAYLVGHDTRSMPVGQTLTGKFTGAQGNGISSVRADVYMINDPSSEPLIAKIRAGIVRDQSIGFFEGEWICSICNRDMAQWWTADGCPHLLGMSYTPIDADGKPVTGAAKVMARATIENAHLAELSGVYDGATPGAMIDKARALADAGMLDHRMHELVQVRYHMRLPPETHALAVPDLGSLRHAQAEEDTVEPEVRIKELETQLAESKKAAAPIEAIRAALAEVTLPEGHAAIGDPAKTIRYMADERARLAPLADDGRAYRADLIEAAMAEGVRANGKEFQQELYKDVLERSPITVIKRMRDDWKAVGDKAFPGGRQSVDGVETKPATGSEDKIPAGAYRTGR